MGRLRIIASAVMFAGVMFALLWLGAILDMAAGAH